MYVYERHRHTDKRAHSNELDYSTRYALFANKGIRDLSAPVGGGPARRGPVQSFAEALFRVLIHPEELTEIFIHRGQVECALRKEARINIRFLRSRSRLRSTGPSLFTYKKYTLRG